MFPIIHTIHTIHTFHTIHTIHAPQTVISTKLQTLQAASQERLAGLDGPPPQEVAAAEVAGVAGGVEDEAPGALDNTENQENEAPPSSFLAVAAQASEDEIVGKMDDVDASTTESRDVVSSICQEESTVESTFGASLSDSHSGSDGV